METVFVDVEPTFLKVLSRKSFFLFFFKAIYHLTCFVSCHVSKTRENFFKESRWRMIDTSIPSLNVTCSHWKASRILSLLWFDSMPSSVFGNSSAHIRKYYSTQSGLKLLALKVFETHSKKFGS